MKCLIVEDDFTARKLMQIYLSEFSKCFVAVNCKEAVQAVTQAFDEDEPYDLIVKVIMTTAKGQSQDIFDAFNTGCEAYLIKPIRKPDLIDEIRKLGLFIESARF